MEVKHDKSYLDLWKEEKEIGITEEKIHRLRFQVAKYKESIGALVKIADWLEENFIMYQYKTKDNYGKHQLFFWSNGENSYFTINYNELHSFEEWDQWTEKIVKYIKENCSNIEGDMYLQYKNCIKWDEVNNYVANTDFDINNLPYEKLKVIFPYRYISGSRLTEENRNKLLNLDIKLHKVFLKSKENQRVVYNGKKGRIKKIKEDEYGFFKPRATKTYYELGLHLIESLEFTDY